ncbi:MAG TPA: AAA family ATPase [Arthrobacter sp.]|nr:AAA family ATPase [Arthrobacter sp.]
MLYGREHELKAIEALLDKARASRGGAIVLRGEPGAGKSALLDDMLAGNHGMRVLRTRGIESESPLAFAALHRLIRPVSSLVESLPAPQARALRAVFGEVEQAAGQEDRFMVFLAVLSLLSELAEKEPVLCVIDDAHWLDEASSAALLFVARRLEAEQLALIFAAREGGTRRFDSGELPSLQVTGLDSTSAEALLQETSWAPIASEVSTQLVRLTAGNPLALMELPEALSAGQLVGDSALPDHLPLTDGVQKVFLDRCRGLPAPAQSLLLVAAIDDSGDLSTVQRAAGLLGAGADALETAEQAGLLRVSGSEIELRHPLVRSAVYAAALSSDRRRAHSTLAEVLDERGDTDRRIWHQAAALDGPDKSVADDLASLAERARRRGGHEAASATWARAAALTPDAPTRAFRLYSAADDAWLSGHPHKARTLAQEARPQTTDPLLLADIDRLRARIEWNTGSVQVGHGIMMNAARDVMAHDHLRARKMAMVATALTTVGGRSDANVEPAFFVPPGWENEPPHIRCYSNLLLGLDKIAHNQMREATPLLQTAFAEAQHLDDWDLLANTGVAAMHLGDDTAIAEIHGRLLSRAREESAIINILYALTRGTFANISLGRWSTVGSEMSEALQLAHGAGHPALTALPLAGLSLVAALRADPVSREHLSALNQVLVSRRTGTVGHMAEDIARWASVITMGYEDPAGSFHRLQQLKTPVIKRLSVIDRMEAAYRGGHVPEGLQIVHEIEDFADATGLEWAQAAAEHGHALFGAPGETDDHFEQALKHHAVRTRPFNKARTELAYGEYLRRSRRRVAAREHLRAALAGFEELGANSWADRSRDELRASGESARKRDHSQSVALTPQELQVALHVQQGMSTKDVAARLFLSPRTIDFHLRNVFSKLGITSRAALAHLDLGQ